ncbi:MAG: alditol oxidase [Actinomycetota bacterium]|nr:FAD-binding protein [Glaciihabitans sp.]MDQ1543236.1 alditol oxidase [Actinomycetota bacterium]MDQ1562009.1 alditol oxidase [Actinomycetota bacterium]
MLSVYEPVQVQNGCMAYNDAEDRPAGTNWADSHAYVAVAVERPADASEVRELVLRGGKVRALGSRHSFTDIADTTGHLLSLERFETDLVIDEDARTASFAPGLRYGDLATELNDRGWAMHNMASLPHISIAGTVMTGTHGSGDRNGTLATEVSALEFIDGTGELVRLSRQDADFNGAVVSLGALGVVTRVTIDIEPTFDVRQDLFNNLPWDAALENFDAITSSAYSVSLFTSWLGDSIEIAWLKSRTDAAAPPTEFYGATYQSAQQHMLPGQPPSNTTTQLGVPGPWNDRLSHFKLGFTPSSGEELQTEYLVPRAKILDALRSMREIGERIAPLLQITELRTMKADDLWLSGAYGTDAVGIHFTWKKLPTEVNNLLPEIEARLLPLGARPHWGKVFRAGVDQVAPLYPRVDDFRALVQKYDPNGLFRNDFLARKLGL